MNSLTQFSQINKDLTSIRLMLEEDLDDVLTIIEAHDDDDAEDAQRDFQDNGVHGHYVLLYQDQVIGTTGARRIEACDNTFKLSWTYMDKQYCSQGLGRHLLQHLLSEISSCNGRKIFVSVSNYVDEDGVAIYAAALALYQSLSFEQELVISDYYDKGEAMIMLGHVLQHSFSEQPDVTTESPKIVFDELFPVAETENTYSFSWKTKLFGRSFTAQDVKLGIEAAYDVKASLVLISFPSNIINVEMPLFEAGFSQVGQLKDYYEDGVHENHYAFRV